MDPKLSFKTQSFSWDLTSFLSAIPELSLWTQSIRRRFFMGLQVSEGTQGFTRYSTKGFP